MRVRHLIVAGLFMFATLATDGAATKTDNQRTYSFVVLGHVIGLRDGMISPLFDELLADIRELNPDLIFLTGDLTCDFFNRELPVEPRTASEWGRLGAELGQLGIPVWRVPGDRDIAFPENRDASSARNSTSPQALPFQGSLFILLNSAVVPWANEAAPNQHSRGKRLDQSQVDFIRKKLSADEPCDHVFLFMHHVLWWSEDDPWWHDVHPLLIGRNVRAVFGGDLGPMKFSHMRRDGIDYIQSGIEQVYAIENPHAVEWLRSSEEARLLARQFDNFLYVTVDGSQVNIDVKILGLVSSGKFSPQRFRAIHGDVGYRYVESSLLERVWKRIWNIIGTPWRLATLALVLGICFLGGVTTMAVWNRWRAG